MNLTISGFILTLLIPLLANATSLPCTYTFEKFPNLCLEITKSKTFSAPAEKDIAKSGGEIYFYFWDKNNPNAKTKNISEEYDISTELVMPAMLRGGPCYVKKLYEEQWRQGADGLAYVGKSLIQAGLYRIGIKIKKKAVGEKYSDIKRLIPVSKTDPVRNDPDFDDWVSQFTYQFSVPLNE